MALLGVGARVAGRLWLVALVLALWEIWTRWRPSLFIPPVSSIAGRFVGVWLSGEPERLFFSRTFIDNVLPSLTRLGTGWSIAAVTGVAAGLLLGRRWPLDAMCQPVIRFGMSMPSAVMLPLALVVLGVNDGMNVLVIAYGSLWPILVNTIDGVQRVDPMALLTARSLRLRTRDVFLRVLLPGASPQILAGLRVSLGIAVILMVTSELYAATGGIGYQIILAQRRLSFVTMWAGILLASLLGVTLNVGFGLLERRLTRWRPPMPVRL
jgi:ABC-type nitrate/sulfonate/bicarbonate transport system permease component